MVLSWQKKNLQLQLGKCCPWEGKLSCPMVLALLHQYQKYLDRLIWKQLCHNRAQILPICCHRHCLALCASQHFSMSASSSCLIILILLPTEGAKSITTLTTQDWSSDQLFGTSISKFLRASCFSFSTLPCPLSSLASFSPGFQYLHH